MMKLALVVAHLHPKNDKRVMRTVNALAEVMGVNYYYWTETPEKPETVGNITYWPCFYKLSSNYRSRKQYETALIERISQHHLTDLVYFHHYSATVPFEFYKPFSKVPIITDFHEYLPDDFLSGVDKIPKWMRLMAGEYVFKGICRRSDRLVAENDFILKAAEKYTDCPKLVVKNYGSHVIKPLSKHERKKEIVFVGKTVRKLDRERPMLEKLHQHGFKITLIGSDSKPPYDFMGCEPFLSYDDMLDRISRAAFSLVSFDPTDSKGRANLNYINSGPHKAYDSVCAGTPIIVADDFRGLQSIRAKVVYRCCNPDLDAEFINLMWTRFYEDLLSQIPLDSSDNVWNETKKSKFIRFCTT
ncbi:MAG: hypothetical protein PHT95_08600 [Candidatus Omnitrophica bacterium]|nr:hypothetical protein [Candidatus Omnitrophota bacterium]